MSISECLKYYENKHGKLIKKNSQSQTNTELQTQIFEGNNFAKYVYKDYTSGEEKNQDDFLE